MSSGSLLCKMSWTLINSGFLIFVIAGSLLNLISPFSILGLTSFSSSSNISCLTATYSAIYKCHLNKHLYLREVILCDNYNNLCTLSNTEHSNSTLL